MHRALIPKEIGLVYNAEIVAPCSFGIKSASFLLMKGEVLGILIPGEKSGIVCNVEIAARCSFKNQIRVVLEK